MNNLEIENVRKDAEKQCKETGKELESCKQV